MLSEEQIRELDGLVSNMNRVAVRDIGPHPPMNVENDRPAFFMAVTKEHADLIQWMVENSRDILYSLQHYRFYLNRDNADFRFRR